MSFHVCVCMNCVFLSAGCTTNNKDTLNQPCLGDVIYTNQCTHWGKQSVILIYPASRRLFLCAMQVLALHNHILVKLWAINSKPLLDRSLKKYNNWSSYWFSSLFHFIKRSASPIWLGIHIIFNPLHAPMKSAIKCNSFSNGTSLREHNYLYMS